MPPRNEVNQADIVHGSRTRAPAQPPVPVTIAEKRSRPADVIDVTVQSDNEEEARLQQKKKARTSTTANRDSEVNGDAPTNQSASTTLSTPVSTNPEPVDDDGLLKDLQSISAVQRREKKQDPTRDVKHFTEPAADQPGGREGRMQKRSVCTECK